MNNIPEHHRITQVQVSFYFQVNGQLATPSNEDEPEAEGELRYAILDEAYKAVDSEFRSFPSANEPCPGEDFTMQSFDICENDGAGTVRDGKVVACITFHSDKPFTPKALSDLKWLCIKAFNEAAEKRNVPVVYAGADEWVKREYTETKDIVIADAAEPATA